MAGSTRTATLTTAVASTSNTITFSNYNVPNDLAAGVLAVYVGGEEDAEGVRPTVRSVTWNGRTFQRAKQHIVDDAGNAFSCAAGIFYLLRPELGVTSNIVVTYHNVCNDDIAIAVCHEGLLNAPPDNVNQQAAEDSSPINTAITTHSSDAFVTDVVCSGDGVTAMSTTQAGQTERSEVAHTSSRLAMSDKQGPSSPGSTTLGWSLSAANRQVHSLVSWQTMGIESFVANNDEWIQDGETGVLLNGIGFEATTGTLELWDDFAGTTQVAQTTTSWSDSQIEFTADRSTIAQGRMYAVVTTNSGARSKPFRLVVRDSAPDPKYAVARVAMNTSTGNQNITTTDLGGVTPQAVLFQITRATADGQTDHAAIGFGAAVSSTSRGAIAVNAEHNVNPSNNDRIGNPGACIELLGSTGLVDAVADFVGFISNGCTINITDAPSAAWTIVATFFYEELLEANVAEVATPAASGLDIVVTAPGFDPDVVIPFTHGGVINNATSVWAVPGIGFAKCRGPGAVIDQVCASWAIEDAVSPITITSTVYSGSAASGSLTFGAMYECAIALEEGDRDSGYRVRHVDGSPGTDEFFVLALAIPGVKSWAGVVNPPTSAVQADWTAPGFKPGLVIQGLTRAATVDTAEQDSDANAFAVSVFTDLAEQSVGISANDGGATSDTDSYIEDRAVFLRDAVGVIFAADFDAMLDTGWQLTYTSADSTQRRFAGLALGTLESAIETFEVSVTQAAAGGDTPGTSLSASMTFSQGALADDERTAPAVFGVGFSQAAEGADSRSLSATFLVPNSQDASGSASSSILGQFNAAETAAASAGHTDDVQATAATSRAEASAGGQQPAAQATLATSHAQAAAGAESNVAAGEFPRDVAQGAAADSAPDGQLTAVVGRTDGASGGAADDALATLAASRADGAEAGDVADIGTTAAATHTAGAEADSAQTVATDLQRSATEAAEAGSSSAVTAAHGTDGAQAAQGGANQSISGSAVVSGQQAAAGGLQHDARGTHSVSRADIATGGSAPAIAGQFPVADLIGAAGDGQHAGTATYALDSAAAAQGGDSADGVISSLGSFDVSVTEAAAGGATQSLTAAFELSVSIGATGGSSSSVAAAAAISGSADAAGADQPKRVGNYPVSIAQGSAGDDESARTRVITAGSVPVGAAGGVAAAVSVSALVSAAEGAAAAQINDLIATGKITATAAASANVVMDVVLSSERFRLSGTLKIDNNTASVRLSSLTPITRISKL